MGSAGTLGGRLPLAIIRRHVEDADSAAFEANIARIKIEEGFRGEVYDDTRGFATIGFGTLLPITENEAEWLLRHRLGLIAVAELAERWPPFVKISL